MIRETIPTAAGATFEKVDQVLRRSGLSNTSSSPGWQCVSGGTTGTLSSVTGTTTANTNTVTLSSATNVPLGSYINVAGETANNKFQVISRDTNTNVVSVLTEEGVTPSSIGVTSASITFVSPIFIAIATGVGEF